MSKMCRVDAEDLAEQVTQMLQPMIKKAVADLLAGEDEDGFTEEERANVDRTVARLRKMGAGKGRGSR